MPLDTIRLDLAVGGTAVPNFLNFRHATKRVAKPATTHIVARSLYGKWIMVSGGDRWYSTAVIANNARAILGGL